jgi:hypothetical protein
MSLGKNVMKYHLIYAVTAILVLYSFNGCASTPRKAGRGDPYFTGDAGENVRIAILEPKGVNIPKGQDWFLSLIQSSVTTDFNRYSNMMVIDRQHLDEVLKEQDLSMSGEYSDDDYIRIGNLTNTQYILTGTLTKTAGVSFLLDLAVTNPETGVRLASFGPKEYSVADIQNMYAANDGAYELLTQMGVEFTEDGRKSIYSTTQSNVSAETALAKGVTAQNSATTIKTNFEAMYYLYEAQSLDPSLLEVADRLQAYRASVFAAPEVTIPEVSIPVQTGNIGKDTRNEIAQYKANRETIQQQQEYLLNQRNILLNEQQALFQKQRELIDLLHESEDFYSEHPPFEIIYSPALERVGEIDYQNETIHMQFHISTIGVPGSLKVMVNILDSLQSMEYGFVSINVGLDEIQEQLTKVNEAGKEYAVQLVEGIQASDKALGDVWSLPEWQRGQGRAFEIVLVLTNEHGKTIGTGSVSLKNNISGKNYSEPQNASAICSFRNVSANDITDVLKVTVSEVSGIDITDSVNSAYIKIAVVDGAGFTADGYDVYGYNKKGLDPFGYNSKGFNAKGYDRDGYNRAGYDKNGYDRGGYNRAGYDRDGYDRNGYNKDKYNKDEYNRAGYDRDGYDRDGYNRAGYNRNGLDREGNTVSQNISEYLHEGFTSLGVNGGITSYSRIYGSRTYGNINATIPLFGELLFAEVGVEAGGPQVYYRLYTRLNILVYELLYAGVGFGYESGAYEKYLPRETVTENYDYMGIDIVFGIIMFIGDHHGFRWGGNLNNIFSEYSMWQMLLGYVFRF